VIGVQMANNTTTAKRLRRQQTDAERILWFRPRVRRHAGWKFKRQVPVDRFIVDFVCADARLVVELDGSQHAVRTRQDEERTRTLEAMGYFVLRFWNNDAMSNLEGVLEEIPNSLNQHSSEPPHPTPLPCGEREQA
jgi:very-short-patch-repair endonuclease